MQHHEDLDDDVVGDGLLLEMVIINNISYPTCPLSLKQRH